jgi:ArsR family transcriptional regulator
VVVKDVAQFFKILADEARLQMLWLLFNHKELCVCDLMEVLGITQSKASRHLATLRHAGLVVDRKAAAWTYYSICAADSELERAVLDTLRAKLAVHLDAARVLKNLNTLLERKDCKADCAPGSAGGTSTPGKSTNRTRVPRSRGKP